MNHRQIEATYAQLGKPQSAGEIHLPTFEDPIELDDQSFVAWREVEFRGKCRFTYFKSTGSPSGVWKCTGIDPQA